MNLQERRIYIEELNGNRSERDNYRVISEALGDDEYLDIDWDELSSLTNLDCEEVEALLYNMAAEELVFVDWKQSVIEQLLKGGVLLNY